MQDLAAQVGGFIKIIMVVFYGINYYYNIFYRDLDILNIIFEFQNPTNNDSHQNQPIVCEKKSKLKDILSRKTSKIYILNFSV